MNSRIFRHIVYWLVILLFLTLYFGYKWENYILAFYFSSLLLPIVIGTSYFFNLYLVPKYLLTGKYGRFAIYFFYMLVVSLYLEMLVSLFSFVIIANYKVDVMGLESISIFILGMTLYLIVFVTSFIRIALPFKEKSQLVQSLQTEIEKNKTETILIRANRKNHQVPIDDLVYIESLDDYVKVVTSGDELNAREKISKLHSQLPDQFIRIHRSFVINKEKVQSYSKTQVSIHNITLPIGRTYKKEVMELLEALQVKL